MSASPSPSLGPCPSNPHVLGPQVPLPRGHPGSHLRPAPFSGRSGLAEHAGLQKGPPGRRRWRHPRACRRGTPPGTETTGEPFTPAPSQQPGLGGSRRPAGTARGPWCGGCCLPSFRWPLHPPRCLNDQQTPGLSPSFLLLHCHSMVEVVACPPPRPSSTFSPCCVTRPCSSHRGPPTPTSRRESAFWHAPRPREIPNGASHQRCKLCVFRGCAWRGMGDGGQGGRELCPQTTSFQAQQGVSAGLTLSAGQPRPPCRNRRGTRAPLTQKGPPTLRPGPFVPSPPRSLPLSPSSPERHVPLCGVLCRPPRQAVCRGTVAPWRGANWICCHLLKLPGAHVCSGYR